jgi:hypothetical protein
VLRLWLAGQAKKAIARQVGIDPKTVRSYVTAALAAGLVATASEVSDELLTKTLAELRPDKGRPRGAAWAVFEREQEEMGRLLVRLSKARKLLPRRGVEVPLHRFAVVELEFGKSRRRCRWPTASRAKSWRSTPAGGDAGPEQRGEAPADASVDLYPERLALPLCLADGGGDDGERDRCLRGSVGVLWGDIPGIETG